jgi:hypothetical protein
MYSWARTLFCLLPNKEASIISHTLLYHRCFRVAVYSAKEERLDSYSAESKPAIRASNPPPTYTCRAFEGLCKEECSSTRMSSRPCVFGQIFMRSKSSRSEICSCWVAVDVGSICSLPFRSYLKPSLEDLYIMIRRLRSSVLLLYLFCRGFGVSRILVNTSLG